MMFGFGAGGWLAPLSLALVLCLSAAPGFAALDPAQIRGKRIYTEGTSSGTLAAIVGEEEVILPASAAPCASCHGLDGLGREEGGLLPPDIRWSQLTKTYGHVHENGREHPAFGRASLARLLRTGLDPGDNRLDRSMPRYQMSDGDMADLMSYIEYLEWDRDPGIEPDRIQVGSLLPLSGSRGRLGQAMAQVMLAYFDELNVGGGVYGRRIELLAVPYGSSPEATLENLRTAFESEGIFALVGAYTVGLDEPILELLRMDQVPLVGPFTLDPGGVLDDAAAFYLYPGFGDQAQVLTDLARSEGSGGGKAMLVAGPQGKHVDRLVEAVRQRLRSRGAVAPEVMRYPAGALDAAAVTARAKEMDAEALFFFGSQVELDVLLSALVAEEEIPRVYLLSSFVPRPLFQVPKAFHYRIFIAYPTVSGDISAQGRAAYQRLAQSHALPRDHIQAQIAAFAAAKLLEEGLRRAGRDLNRRRLVEALERLYSYKTGVTPPLSYGPNRRIGALGAHVVAVDLMKKVYEPVGGWHELR
jgi:ABC-type branched-subunit amino acid transport system substrate-binding protein